MMSETAGSSHGPFLGSRYGRLHDDPRSPVGELLLVGEPTPGVWHLTSVLMTGQRNAPAAVPLAARDRGVRQGHPAAPPSTSRTADRLDLDLGPRGAHFQQRIWRALDSVRYGTTITYGELAAQLGVPRDRVVALGAAVGANPLLIVRPCHRVVGADGMMRGYAGGVERKRWLLSHEGALLPESA